MDRFNDRFNKVICAGLHRTGTSSLWKALHILGVRPIHFHPERLGKMVTQLDTNWDSDSFRVFDDVDAILDMPGAFFWEELLRAYPGSGLILTIRDDCAWWRSVSRYFPTYPRINDPEDILCRILSLTYGYHKPAEYTWRKKYWSHNNTIMRSPVKSLLLEVTNSSSEMLWRQLVSFLGLNRALDTLPEFPKDNAWGNLLPHFDPSDHKPDVPENMR